MNNSNTICILICFFIHLIIACSSENDSIEQETITLHSFNTLQLKTVFEFSESEDVAFQNIARIHMDIYGNILVRDFYQPQLYMFDQTGNLTQKIGRIGHGPGEFQRVSSFITKDNQLFISDRISHKIERFEYQQTGYEHMDTITHEDLESMGRLLGMTEKGFIAFRATMLFADQRDNPSEGVISLFDHQGRLFQDSLVTYPLTEMLIDASGQIVHPIMSFGNSPYIAFDQSENLYSLWSNALDINQICICDGTSETSFFHPLTSVEVTSEERDSVLNSLPNQVRSEMRRQFPDVKPIVNGLLVDDQQNIWIDLLAEELGHGWFSFSPTGNPIILIEIPRPGAVLQHIQGDKVLWNYLKEDGTPTIVMSEIQEIGI